MRILVVGAGAIGGYYGGRLAAGGADVTFLVRGRRAEQLRSNGLVVKSPLGDVSVPVKTILPEEAAPGWDAIVLACRAFQLEQAIETVRPAAPGALILPQLNGMRHLDALDAAFGRDNVCGGVAAIAVTVEPDGTVRHLNRAQVWIHGPRSPAQHRQSEALQADLVKGGFDPKLSDNIILDMWEKWVFLCSLAAMCSLMRAPVGPIVATQDGAELMREMLDDCAAAGAAVGFAPRERYLENARRLLTEPGSAFAASMLRDVQGGLRTEADHIVGDMLERVRAAGRPATLLRAAYAHLQVYEAGRGQS